MKHTLFDERKCQLGEGPFWHPERQDLFWFDVLDKKLLSSSSDAARTKEDPVGKTFLIKDAFMGHSNEPVKIDTPTSDLTA